MPLTIKSKATERLARRLARLTGESVARAVHEAVRERLDRLETRKATPRPKASADELMAIGRRCAAQMGRREPVDHARLLYDDKGLPH